jgi:hypothetical protein
MNEGRLWQIVIINASACIIAKGNGRTDYVVKRSPNT